MNSLPDGKQADSQTAVLMIMFIMLENLLQMSRHEVE